MNTSNATAAAPSTPNCQAKWTAVPSSTAPPRIAPIAAGPAAIGAILGGAVLLGSAVHFGWQFGLLAAAAIALLVFNRGVVAVLLSAGVIGVVAGLAGAPLPH